MEYIAFFLLFSFAWACIYILKLFRTHRRFGGATKLPPGPRPFPVIGNFFELGKKPHVSLAKLSKTYGSIMTLKLGRFTTIVISSPHFAKQVLQKHDDVLSNRLVPDSTRALDHNKVSMVWLPIGPRWRNLRKICTIQLLTAQRLDASQALRRKKVQELLDYVNESCKNGQAVDIGRSASTTSLNLLSNTFFSIDLATYGSSLSQEFRNLVWGLLEEVGRPNIADFVPGLKSIDPQGVRRRSTVYHEKLFAIFDGIIEQRKQSRISSTNSSANNDVLDALLNIVDENGEEFSCSDLKHLILDLFVAGTDTTSSTLEWAMAELLHNPTIMAKAKAELQEVIGKDRPIQESDASSLPYLQAIVKETLRLHPAAPIIGHKAAIDVEINGFMVPKDAIIQVNLWAIFQDPNIWSFPTSFMPERFLDQKIDFVSRDFEFIPFGAGRRMCPGMPLAHRMVHLMLASLLHSFDWKLENGEKPEDMDMDDKFGITLQMAKPLRAIPIKV